MTLTKHTTGISAILKKFAAQRGESERSGTHDLQFYVSTNEDCSDFFGLIESDLD